MSLIRFASKPRALFAGLLLLAGMGIAPLLPAQAASDEEADESSKSGLRQVATFDVTAGFVRPGADFSAFDKVMFLECSTAFVDGWQDRVNRRRKPNERVTDRDMELLTEDLSKRFYDVFTEEFTDRGDYQLVDKEAKGVLLVRPAVFDVDLVVPRNSKGLFLGTSTSEGAGAASLFIELYDAATGTLLARLIDRRQVRDLGVTQVAGRATNSLGMRKQLTLWARVVLDGIQELEQNPIG